MINKIVVPEHVIDTWNGISSMEVGELLIERRLNEKNGMWKPLEETKPIRCKREMEECLWNISHFKGTGKDFKP